MAVVQDTFASAPAKGFPGMVVNGETSNRISRTVEDVAGIAFGKAAFRGTGDHGCTATPAAGTFMGVTIADHGIVPLPGGVAADVLPRYETAGLLIKGAIYVIAGAAVADGEAVFVTPAGAFTNVPTANFAAGAFVFDETVASGGVVRIAAR